ncbi:hypothetical protein QOZ80_5AG0408060 [Eleusine coracana subsp. coracana]|nr:hypothetical protein QOZ80_5AG0408060 [Eleusine coracana subsp. coracana]
MLEKRRKRLLLFAVLAGSMTYQAGLTPPGGFRLRDGHHAAAGVSVLFHNFPHRYNAFFYCNSVSFMLSIALILLLVNPDLYKPAIQSQALTVCTGAGMFSLVGAYAAGSTQYLKTSIKIFALVALILIVLVLAVLLFVLCAKETPRAADGNNNPNDNKEEKDEQHSKRKHLMLLGILGVSVTYQVGLKPPGGVWQSNSIMGQHSAGNPVMYDNERTRYMAFFFVNSTSFVATVIVIILLLLEYLRKELRCSRMAMNITIVLGLLVAYALGSSRSWKTTGYVFALVLAVLAYIAIHILVSYLIGRENEPAPKKEKSDEAASSSNNEAEKNAFTLFCSFELLQAYSK